MGQFLINAPTPAAASIIGARQQPSIRRKILEPVIQTAQLRAVIIFEITNAFHELVLIVFDSYLVISLMI